MEAKAMTDWISDAKTACEAFSDAKTLRGEKILEYQMTINTALPRALKAIKAADELAKTCEMQPVDGKVAKRQREALAAYQEARK